jgi:transcriptional regulator with XRE-family HTH domain
MAAQEFERIVRDAMDREDLSLSALARESGVDRGRWYAWFRGDNAPQPRTLRKAATALGLQVTQLTAPWGGMGPVGPEGVTDAGIRDLMTAVNDLVGLLRPLAEQAVDREARLRALEAELQSLRARPVGARSRGRSAPRATVG